MTSFDLIVLALVFILVFGCTRAALGRSEPFAHGPRSIMAFCVAALSVAGLLRGFTPADGARQSIDTIRSKPLIDFVLLPYAALGLTLLIGLLVLLLCAIRRRLPEWPRRRGAAHQGPESKHQPEWRD